MNDAGVLDRVRKADNLPALPEVVVEILRLISQPSTRTVELVRLIERDPALAARLLKVVNSSLFGMPRKITTLDRATVLLGTRGLQVLVLSFSLAEGLARRRDAGFDFRAFWRRSLTTAVGARLLAGHACPNLGSEAFVCGLLSEIGTLAAFLAARADYGPLLDQHAQTGQPLHEIERRRWGITHAVLGREVLTTWHLPEALCWAVGTHHGEDIESLPPQHRTLAALVRLAADVADVFCEPDGPARLDPMRLTCQRHLSMSPGAFDGLLGKIKDAVDEAARVFSVPVGDTPGYDTVQAMAADRLVELALKAEADRTRAAQAEQSARAQAEALDREKRTLLLAACTDPLTQVANRACLEKRLEEEMDRARSTRRPLGLIMFDIDRFKQINDLWGHQAGDQVLCQIARRLQAVVNDAGLAARYGGDEFAVVLANRTGPAAARLAEQIRRRIVGTEIIGDTQRFRVTPSLGCACTVPESPQFTGRELIAHADRLLYRAKRLGGNRVESEDVPGTATPPAQGQRSEPNGALSARR